MRFLVVIEMAKGAEGKHFTNKGNALTCGPDGKLLEITGQKFSIH